jgi:hypothetical protein
VAEAVEQVDWPVSKPVSNIVKIMRDLTMVVVENQVRELFKLRHTLNMYLYQQTMAIILSFDQDPGHQFKSEKTLSMVLLFRVGHISAACEPHHVTPVAIT